MPLSLLIFLHGNEFKTVLKHKLKQTTETGSFKRVCNIFFQVAIFTNSCWQQQRSYAPAIANANTTLNFTNVNNFVLEQKLKQRT